MKTLFALLLLFAITIDPVTRIAKVNRLKKEAKKAMEAQNYRKAILHYTELIDSLAVDDDNLKMNLANAAYNLSYGLEDRQFMNEAGKLATNTPPAADTATATVGTKNTELKFAAIAENKYLELVNSADKTIASGSCNQRGIIAYIQSEKEKGGNKEGLFEQSLAHFKKALRKNSANEAARYNYELLKKMKQKQEKQKKQDQKNQDQEKQNQKQDQKKQDQKEQQQNKDQKKQEQKEKEKKQNQEQKEQKQGQKKEEQKFEDAEKTEEQKEKEKQEKLKKFLEKLKEMKISREKAEMILEAMKNNEIQYVQQNKRKAKKKKDHSKPDW